MTADVVTNWQNWRAKSFRSAVLFDDYETTRNWDAVNEAYAAAWWRSLSGTDRLAWYVADAYDRLLAYCVEAETARELAGHPILVSQAEKLQAQFQAQTIPHGMLKAQLANRAIERYKDRARAWAAAQLDAAIRANTQPPYRSYQANDFGA